MALKRTKADPGTVVVLEHVSRILKDNPLGDPHVRKLAVWRPDEYQQTGRRFPVLCAPLRGVSTTTIRTSTIEWT